MDRDHIRTTYDKLQGQIIINAEGLDAGVWSGDVTVAHSGGALTLSPEPHYDDLPSTFGGGAVGYAGFTFHPYSSSPQHEEVLAAAPSSVVVDHYGPIYKTPCDPDCPPLKVEYRDAGSSNSWNDQTGDMQFTVESTYPHRRITITPESGQSFLENMEYRLTPQFMSGGSGMTRLKSRFDTNTVGVVVYDYRFTIITGSFGPP